VLFFVFICSYLLVIVIALPLFQIVLAAAPAEYSKGLILPRCESENVLKKTTVGTKIASRANSLSIGAPVFSNITSESGVGCRIHTTKVSLTETFMTSVQELYNTLTSQEVGTSLVPGQHDHSSLVTRERETPTVALFSLSEAEN